MLSLYKFTTYYRCFCTQGKRTKQSQGLSIQNISKLGAAITFTGKPQFIKHRIDIFTNIQSKLQKMYQQIPKTDIIITLKDGKQITGNAFQTTPYSIAKKISKHLGEVSLVSRVKYSRKIQNPWSRSISSAEVQDTGSCGEEYELVDMMRPLEGDCQIQFLTFEDKIGKEVFWHSSSHLLGQSLQNLYGAWLCHGPPLQNGFFYDSFIGDSKISQNQYDKIEKEIKKYAHDKQPFQRIILTKKEALQMFAYNPFKKQLIQRKIPEAGFTTAYRVGDLVDLCTGPHLPSANYIKGFKVMKNSSAYWLGKKQNDDLQRIYGISFPKQNLLDEYLKLQEQLAKRDHRTIGSKQDLFHFTTLSPGSALFFPHGTIIYNKLVELMRSEYRIRGYSEVISPNIYNSELWKISGHYFKYKENIYWIEQDDEEFGLKPMNCPGHCIMFNTIQHSYKDLPIRYADFGVLHRNQLHGALSGLTRVRRFQQDDAHIFCMPDQIQNEILGVLDLIDYIYSVFGFRYAIELSTRPEQYLGKIEDWDEAENQLKKALQKFGRQYKINEGDGAFYGPKIDVKLFDAFGRQHQCGTVQLDFQLPLRFNLQYRAKAVHLEHQASNSDKKVKQSKQDTPIKKEIEQKYDSIGTLKNGFERPVIIHRAIFGSMERFIAILCEHTGGKWDFWVSPRQLKILPVSKDNVPYAQSIESALSLKGFYVHVDKGSDKLEKKVRNAQMEGYNYIGVIGAKEVEQGTITLRKRDEDKPIGTFPISEVVSLFQSFKAPKSRKRLETEEKAFKI